jgi:uroporphyrinogen decarboxylase
MTSKERITVALKGGIPDRVPVTMGLSEMVPVKYCGNDYIEFFIKNKMPIWKARVETEYDRFHSDSFLHLCEGASPDDPEKTQKITRETTNEVFLETIWHTSAGDLSQELYITRNSPFSIITPYVKDLDQDIPKVKELLKNPGSKDLTDLNKAYQEIGNRAHVGYWLESPVDWWSSLRGTQEMIMDLMLYPEIMSDLFNLYTEYAVSLTDHILKNSELDSVCLGGSNTSMSVISPELHRRFSLPFGKVICRKAHSLDYAVQYHMCGKSRESLGITADMGIDGFDALECAPTGNVDLHEVKKTFGKNISLRGNVNSIHVMLNGSPEDVEKAVKQCMDAAKAGGGYILGVGDQTPQDTPEENLIAFVEAGKKYGKY